MRFDKNSLSFTIIYLAWLFLAVVVLVALQ